jgi:Arc/MetJ family transcription regulator
MIGQCMVGGTCWHGRPRQRPTTHLHKYVKYPDARARTLYDGVSDRIRVQTDAALLARAWQEYGLSARQKNFTTLARAFALVKDRIAHGPVVAGQPRYMSAGILNILCVPAMED